MSVEFMGVGGPGQIGNLKKVQKTQDSGKTTGAGKDTVEFSTVLQDVNKAQSTSQSTGTDRAERVQELKAQIREGSYEPDLNKVSASLLQFLVEGK